MNNTLLIDAAYLLKAAPGHFDYEKLLNVLEGEFGSIRDRYYFNAIPNPEPDEMKAFHNYMRGARPRGPHFRLKLYELKTMDVQCRQCGAQIERTLQKGVDVGLATLAIKLGVQDKFERLVVAAGDGDFDDALSYVRDELNKEVCIIGFRGSVSVNLQSLSDRTFFLDDIFDEIRRF